MTKRLRSTSRRVMNPSHIKDRESPPTLPEGYVILLEDIKDRIRFAQLKAAISVNRELISLYWDIGKLIVQRQETEGWGKSVVLLKKAKRYWKTLKKTVDAMMQIRQLYRQLFKFQGIFF